MKKIPHFNSNNQHKTLEIPVKDIVWDLDEEKKQNFIHCNKISQIYELDIRKNLMAIQNGYTTVYMNWSCSVGYKLKDIRNLIVNRFE